MGTRTERAHAKYRDGHFEEALELYTDALSAAKSSLHCIALHLNRAACFLKLRNYIKAVEECSSVLELDPKHTGALMLRAQTLVATKDYHSALFDVNRLIEINPTSDAYRSLQARLRTQLSLAPIPEAEDEGSMDLEESETNKLSIGSSKASTLSTIAVKGWDSIPKPKGHSGLDYSRWDRFENELSDSEEDDNGDSDDDAEPRFKFRLKNVDVHTVNQK